MTVSGNRWVAGKHNKEREASQRQLGQRGEERLVCEEPSRGTGFAASFSRRTFLRFQPRTVHCTMVPRGLLGKSSQSHSYTGSECVAQQSRCGPMVPRSAVTVVPLGCTMLLLLVAHSTAQDSRQHYVFFFFVGAAFGVVYSSLQIFQW